MTKDEAIKTLKENSCAMCAYCSKDMDSCDIRSCDNKDAIKVLEEDPYEDKTLQIVINVPEKLVCDGFERPFTEEEKNVLIKAIGNGRLIDDMLDEIRSEILHLHDWAFDREEILRIIDKYKSEKEAQA